VQARIRPCHDLLRTEIERFGGTVEKFIGDAVMAVFGAPLAHEDDAERAVRADLRIVEAIKERSYPGEVSALGETVEEAFEVRQGEWGAPRSSGGELSLVTRCVRFRRSHGEGGLE
jgi:class 3 adenylate cyclase